ncbi:MAG: hypothetical protein IMF01_09535 [Proteobacteria bacterium]|nr:hypothetical protein [Pseudomonadota bacterium]
MKIILGVDPGSSGGLCTMDMDGNILELHKMPIFEIDTGKVKKGGKPKMRKQIDFRGLFNILEPIYKSNEVEAYTEEITHLFGLPSSSNFTLGYACGVVHSALQTFGEFYLVKPRLWQKEVWQEVDYVHKLTKSGAKKIDPKPTSKACADRLYKLDTFIPKGGRKPHDGLMDAALIAEYGRRHQL